MIWFVCRIIIISPELSLLQCGMKVPCYFLHYLQQNVVVEAKRSDQLI